MTEGQISMSSQGPAAQIGASTGADLAGLIEGYSQRIDLVRRQLGQVIFGQEQTVEQALNTARQAWVQVARGSVSVNGTALNQGDGAAVLNEGSLSIRANTDAEFLLFDLARS